VKRQRAVRFEYDRLVFDEGFRTDLLIDHQVIVELKSVGAASSTISIPPRLRASQVNQSAESGSASNRRYRLSDGRSLASLGMTGYS